MRLIALLLLLAPSAFAQDMPACTDSRAGAVACMAGKLCSCGYVRGGIMSGRPDGWQWDCGILRPACGEALAPPGIPQQAFPMPQLYLNVPAPDMPQPPPWGPPQQGPFMSPWHR